MKIISSLFIALVAAADPPPTYSDYKIGDVEYIKKSDKCMSCIDEIGAGKFSNICYGKKDSKMDKTQVYCCNSSPPEPPLSNSPQHDYLNYLNLVNTYLDYNKDENKAKVDSHNYYCPIDNSDLCTPDIKMHLGLKQCFIDDLPTAEQPDIEKCQALQKKVGDTFGTNLLSDKALNPVKNAGRLDGDQTNQTAQSGHLVYGNNVTQSIQSLQPKVKAKTCYWEIQNDYMKKYIRIQDMYVKFQKIVGAKIYITSYFRVGRESNTIYPKEVQKSLNDKTNITYEMYNTTFIYMIPTTDTTNDYVTFDTDKTKNEVLFDFWVYQTAEFQYGTDYTFISKLISGAGGTILILSVITYLDGPSTVFKWIKNQKEERDRIAKEELALKKQGGKDAALLDGKKGGKQGDQDTQKSNDEMSEEDINYNQLANEDPAVHEGGRISRPGSNGSDARPQKILRVNHINDSD